MKQCVDKIPGDKRLHIFGGFADADESDGHADPIRDCQRHGKKVTVRMTLTGPGCPVGPQILAAVHGTVAKQPGVETPDVQLVWDPQWNPVVHASEEAKDALGIW